MRYFWLRLLIKLIGRHRSEYLYFKKFLYVIKQTEEEIKNTSANSLSQNVWTMWLQDDIPEICETCINRIKQFYPETIVITEKNLNNYIDIPEIIYDKYKKGIIKPCHFSDLVRVMLLDKFGGVWIDATCFLTQPIPNYIINSELFLLKDFHKKYFSNFFMKANQNNFYIKLMKNFLLEYWKRETITIEYFFFNTATLLFKNKSSRLNHLWNQIPIGISEPVDVLRSIMYDKFNDDIYEWIKKSSYLHKLTYKNIPSHSKKDSYYEHIIEEVKTSQL